MPEVLNHILILVGGVTLMLLADWNIKKDDEQGRNSLTRSYWMKFFIGGCAVFVGVIFLLKDLLSYFELI